MNDHKWWFKQLRIVQYNLQMKDTPLMDAEKIARETEEMNGNAVVINVADSVVWYRTAVRFQRINPYLPEDRDILEELIQAFHKRGIKVIARGAFMGFEEETYYQKPEWAARNVDGTPIMIGNERPGEWYRLYRPCPNSGFVTEGGGLNVAREAFQKYDLDGAFWLGGASLGGDCYCDHCKRLYFEAHGKQMPSDPAQLDRNWNIRAAKEHATGFFDGVMDAKEGGMPFLRYYWPFALDIGIGFKLPPDNIDLVSKQGNTLCTEAQDVLSLGVLKLPEWNTPALRMKMGRTIENYPPPVGIIHACPGMDWRHACLPEAEFMYWASQIPANGGSYWTTFTGFADTIPDKRMLKAIGRLNRMTEKTEEDMFGASSDCAVMLLSDAGIHVQGWAEALMCAHIDYDMLAHYQLSLDRIKKYPLVIVPKGFAYPEDAKAILEAYASGGGRLIIEGTEEMALRPVRGLLDVEDDEITCSEELAATYLRIEPSAAFLQERMGDCDIVPLRGRVGFCHAKETAKVLTTWVPPFASVATAGFPPERASLPISRTDIPLCVVNEAGNVMFLPYEPSKLIRVYGMQDMFAMIQGYVEFMLADAKKIAIKAPRRVMATVFAKGKAHLIHFVNGIGQRPLQETIPCFDMEIDIQLDGKGVASVESVIAGIPLTFEAKGDKLTIHVPRLDVWDMVKICYA